MWRRMLSSKKTIATISGVIFTVFVVPIAEILGANITGDQVYQVVAIIIAYIVGQGVADNGKEAAKVVTSNAPVPASEAKTLPLAPPPLTPPPSARFP